MRSLEEVLLLWCVSPYLDGDNEREGERGGGVQRLRKEKRDLD